MSSDGNAKPANGHQTRKQHVPVLKSLVRLSHTCLNRRLNHQPPRLRADLPTITPTSLVPKKWVQSLSEGCASEWTPPPTPHSPVKQVSCTDIWTFTTTSERVSTSVSQWHLTFYLPVSFHSLTLNRCRIQNTPQSWVPQTRKWVVRFMPDTLQMTEEIANSHMIWH